MSKDKIQLLSPLFLKYQTDYEKNPRSRVFAPLAEIYRKLGMTDKAMEILSQGIRFHPTYVMGYLGLAFCYFDLKQFSLAYNTLRPLVETSRDNIRLQKLFADICLELGYREESLDTYKYLLFINPRDREVAMQVATLESLIEEQYKPVHQPIYIPESEFRTEKRESSHQLFDIDKLDNKPLSSKADFDDWMAVDLSRDQKEVKSEDPYEFWNLKKGDTPVDLNLETKENVNVTPSEEISYKVSDLKLETKPSVRPAQEPYVELSFEDDLSDEAEDNEIELEKEETKAPSKTTVPMVTHTLVDLYCGQGHIEKALEVLEKILILNPTDERTINKISEIKALMGPYEEVKPRPAPVLVKEISIPQARPHLEPLKEISEEDGRKNLMSILDQQLGAANEPLMKEIAKGLKEDKKASTAAKKPTAPAIVPVQSLDLQKNRQIEDKLTEFLKKIQKRALDYQSRL